MNEITELGTSKGGGDPAPLTERREHELRDAIHRLKAQASELDKMARHHGKFGNPIGEHRCKIKAGVYRAVHSDLIRLLPESGGDEKESSTEPPERFR